MIKALVKVTGDTEGDKRDPEKAAFYQQCKDTFNAFDKDGSGKLDVGEFIQAWRFLEQPGTEEEISDIFTSIDCDSSGHIEGTEFLFAIMGEEANQYGALADMELLNRLLNQCAGMLSDLSDSLKASKDNQDMRAVENKKLMAKLKASRSQLNTEVNDMVSKMMGMTGDDFFDMEEIDITLREAFARFDENKNGTLDKWEFTQAWSWLGLKGAQSEIADAFDKVDKNKSGTIDQDEFMTAIKSERLAELNLRVVMKKMGVHMDTVEERYQKFKNSSVRRRLMKKEMDEQLETKMALVIDRLREISGRVENDSVDQAKLRAYYKTLKETFNAFDADGSAELQFPEYKEAWKFLKQPDNADLIKKSFDGVDFDQSGYIEWSEFVFSIMKEDAGKVGPLADLETLNQLLDEVDSTIRAGTRALSEVQESVEERQRRNAKLKNKMKGLRGDMNSQLNQLMGSLGVASEGENFFDEEAINKALVKCFHKFDKDNSGWLGFTEFARAWEDLGLGSREDEIMRAYYKVDEDRSGSIEVKEFTEAITGEKMDELNMNLIFAKMGDELGVKLENVASSKDRFKSFEMTAQRRRVLKKKMEEDMKSNLAVLVGKLCELLNKPVPDVDGRKLYQTMIDTFNAFDNDGSGALNFSEFKEAWRFLQKPGDDRRIKSAFDNQDVDGSLHVDQNEFAFALMGQEALKYGPLAEMELLNGMLDQVSGNMMAQLAAEGSMKKSAEQQARDNDALRRRLETLKSQQDSDMAKMIGKINALAGMDELKFMSE